MTNLAARVLAGEPGADGEITRLYTQRLLGLARKALPRRVRQRIDPEDVVQSVYRSFFRRLNDGQFTFEESHDVWRLLAAMTFHKARNTAKYHHRRRRDVRRDEPLPGISGEHLAGTDEATPAAADLEVLFQCLDWLLAALPEHYRAIVVRRLEGASIEQIAQEVKRSRRTVLRVLAHLPVLAAKQEALVDERRADA